MNYKQAKKGSDIHMEGVSFEFVNVDGSTKSVIVRDDKGGMAEIIEQYGSVRVNIPAGPTMVKKWRLKGTVLNLPVLEFFDDKYAAQARRDEFASKLGVEDGFEDLAEVEIPEAP